MVLENPYPLYDTTFILHRVSPLFTNDAQPFTNASLRQHARRFRDILAGDVLRGVRVGLVPDDDTLSRVGALKTVTWRLLPSEEAWNEEAATLRDGIAETTNDLPGSTGMLITVNYDKMSYSAILLSFPGGDPQYSAASLGMEAEFHHFPLLMTKMPGALRDTFTRFLEETFDARISVLHLQAEYLTMAFEKYITDVMTRGNGEGGLAEGSRALRKIVKEVQILIGFDLPRGSAAIKTFEISFAREDIPRMVVRGKKLARAGDQESPFTSALAAYLKAHLAMDLRHEKVNVVRIACGAFILGAEGKMKITNIIGDDGDRSQRRATEELVGGLVRIAASIRLSAPK